MKGKGRRTFTASSVAKMLGGKAAPTGRRYMGKGGTKRGFSSRAPGPKGLYAWGSGAGLELKFQDIQGFGQMDTTAGIQLINGTQQGIGRSQRIGGRIQMRSIECKGVFYTGVGTTIAFGRWAIVYDKQPNGALPAFTDIYETVGDTTTLREITNKPRFWVLHDSDSLCFAGSSATYQTDTACQAQNWYKRVNLPVQYNISNSGTITDITSGALYLVYWGNQLAGSSAPGFDMNVRFRYSDD